MNACAERKGCSGQEDETRTMSLGKELHSQSICMKPDEGNPSSSSWSHLKSSFVGMGFSPTLVDKVIKEKGEGNVNLLLESLCTYSEVLQKMSSESLDLPDGIVALCEAENSLQSEYTAYNCQEIEVISNDNSYEMVDKKIQLCEMGFTEDEISSAMEKVGADIPIMEIADSIFAHRFANACLLEDKIQEDASVERKMEMLQSASVIALL